MNYLKTIQKIIPALLLLGVFLSACSQPTPEPTPTALPPTETSTQTPTETSLPPTATATETSTPVPPTSTATATETLEPTSTHTTTPTETVTNTPPPTPESGEIIRDQVEDPIAMYFIQVKSGGPVACGDSVIGVGIGVSRSNDVSNDITLAVQALLGQRAEWIWGLYNPLSHSSITLSNVSFSNGLATVELRGTYTKPEDDCDNLRVKAQIWSTVKQFHAVKTTNIYLNNIPFGDRLSNDK